MGVGLMVVEQWEEGHWVVDFPDLPIGLVVVFPMHWFHYQQRLEGCYCPNLLN